MLEWLFGYEHEMKLAYIKLKSKTPCPPRGVSRIIRILPLICVILVIAGVFAWNYLRSFNIDAAALESTSFKQPETLKELLALSPAELDAATLRG